VTSFSVVQDCQISQASSVQSFSFVSVKGIFRLALKKALMQLSGSYTFSFGSEGTLLLGSAMLWTALNTNHYALLNLKNTATKVCSSLNQTVIPSISLS